MRFLLTVLAVLALALAMPFTASAGPPELNQAIYMGNNCIEPDIGLGQDGSWRSDSGLPMLSDFTIMYALERKELVAASAHRVFYVVDLGLDVMPAPDERYRHWTSTERRAVLKISQQRACGLRTPTLRL